MPLVKVGIVIFPGSNCDHDAYYAFKELLQCDTKFLWHKEGSIGNSDIVILPGGFSYGDYLRAGAIARFSPIMKDIVRFANRGGIVIGICNGFQILCEAGLLPGTLLRNQNMKFICKSVPLIVENNKTIFTAYYNIKEIITVPIAHGEGNYFCDEDTLTELLANNQVVFRYKENPNGSINDIAGIQNVGRNILGMMPHPERACEKILGSNDGLKLLKSVVDSFQ